MTQPNWTDWLLTLYVHYPIVALHGLGQDSIWLGTGDQPATVRQCQVPSIACLKFSYCIGSAASPLPLRPDFVSEDKIGNQAQGEEENPKYDEVQVKFGIFYIQFFQDGL